MLPLGMIKNDKQVNGFIAKVNIIDRKSGEVIERNVMMKCEHHASIEDLNKDLAKSNGLLKIIHFFLAIQQKIVYLYNMNQLEQVKKELNRELDLGLALSKAEGNLNFLAGESQQNNWQSSITQGMAILDALEAVQVARKAWQEIIHEKRKAN